MNPLQYIVTFARAAGGAIIDGLIARPNFNDMANLSLTSPSNGSATFNGTSDYIQVNPTFTNIIGTGKSGSVCGWVYLGVTNATQVWFEHRADALNRLVLWFNQSGSTLNFYPNSGAATPFAATSNRWYFVSATWNGTTASWYVDGSLISTNAYTPFNTSETYIGIQTPVFGQYWMGNLANVAVWNRALTSDEINSIQWKRYDLLTSGESTGLVAWYALDDITGTSVPDSTGTYNATAY